MAPILASLVASLAAAPAGIPPCRPSDLAGSPQRPHVVDAHRQAPLPTVVYRSGAKPKAPLGFEATFLIDAEGRIACYRLKGDGLEKNVSLNAPRRAWLETLEQVRYGPFAETPAIVSETVREVRAIRKVRQPPDVPLDQVTITLDRSACYGSCPSYTVEIRGDGQVAYTGSAHVDVTDEHRYRVPVDKVAALVDSLRRKQLWSMEKEYAASITDNPEHVLTLQLGNDTHTIRNYVGSMVGMPVEVDTFEAEVDSASGAKQWVNLGVDAVAQLEKEGFDAKSPAAAEMLGRAAENERSDDAAIKRLVTLGATTDGLLIRLLLHRHVEAARLLLDRGAVRKNDAVDPAALDAAFVAAISGGRLAGVEAVWAAGGDVRPAMTGQHGSTKTVPVALLLDRDWRDDGWEGLQIAQWLVAHGGELRGNRADGDTLLHVASRANDVTLVRYLLAQGLDPSGKGEYGLPAIGSTYDEDVALTLLQAGSDLAGMQGKESNFYKFAKSQEWTRVIAWLDAHKP